MKFHHIGIATKDIKKTFKFVKNNFEVIDFTDIIYDQKQDAYVQLITTNDNQIELVSGKQVENLIKKNITYYHICYEVKNINEAINNFSDALLISKPKEAILFENRKVAFLLTPIGLVELLEER